MRRTSLFFALCMGVLVASGSVARAQDAVCAKVKLVIPQKLTFERDAFDAMLTLTNNLSDAALDDLQVDVILKTMTGDPADDSFAVSVTSLEHVTAVDGTGTILPNEMGTLHWLLIPTPGAGGTLPGGIQYRVKATISYSVNGQPFDLETFEEVITVKPQPLLVLDYFLPQQVWGDDPFTPEAEPIIPFDLAVRVSNIGWGPAKNLQIESAQPVIVENDKGLLIDFKIIGTWLDGSAIAKTLTILFGTLEPKTCGTGSWAMTSSLLGKFTELNVTFRHKDELGGEKTSLVEAANSHWLTHVVQLDTPGKDGKPDMLAYELDAPDEQPTVVYESDCNQSPVVTVPATSSGAPSLTDPVAHITATVESGWCYLTVPDPASGNYPIQKVIRDSDGKVLHARNAWVTKDKDKNPIIGMLDFSKLGPLEETYTIYYDLSEFDATPPVSELTFVGPWASATPIVVSNHTIINTTATDDMAGVAKRELRKDGGAWEAAAPFFFQTPGDHLLEYRATDKKGNVEPTRVAAVFVDAVAPVVTPASPVAGQIYFIENPLPIDVTVDDLDPSPSVEATLVPVGAGLGIPVTVGAPADLSGAAPGEWNLVVLVRDFMDNQATVVIGPFTLEEYVPPPPVVVLSGVSDGAFSGVPVAVGVAVTPTDVTVEATLDGAPYVPGTAVTGDGSHTVVVTATDPVGQTGTAQVSFVVDQTAPSVVWSGVEGGVIYDAPVTPVVAIVDANLATEVVTLDGAPFTSGSAVATEGVHVVQAQVVDKAGNESVAKVTFTVDMSAPVIEITGVDDGASYAAEVAVDVKVTDLTLGAFEILLDGGAYVPLTPIDGEGPHTVTVTAADGAGHDATVSVSFLLDLTPPVIEVTGVVDGASYKASVTPEVTFADDHLTDTTLLLDGQPFDSGTEVADGGEHVLQADATDIAGNTTSVTTTFTIDTAAPLITVTGVAKGATYPGPVTPVVVIEDEDLNTSTTTLDGQPFETGTEVAAEGPHTLAVSATDTAGNSASQSVAFTIDMTPPDIVVTGVTDGVVYGVSVVPKVTVTDATSVTTVTTVDGAPFTSGGAVSSEGPHTLEVLSTDKAGNQSSATIVFVIDKTAPSVVITGIEDGAYYATAVTPDVQVDDATQAALTVTLDGAAFEPATEVATEGPHTVNASAIDEAGNEAGASASFVLDFTEPVITLLGVTDGELTKAAVTPSWSVEETNLATVEATLDGQPIEAGAHVGTGGSHVLVVTATDKAGNSAMVQATFTIDLVAPVLTVAGVDDGDVTQGPVVLDVQVDDGEATVETKVNGVVHVPGTPIAAEGPYTVVATATDLAGNVTTVTLAFVVDVTAPKITVTGVADGGIYNKAVTPTIAVEDDNPMVTGILLDGDPFLSGTTVTEEATYVLAVMATDEAGNQSEVTITFTIDLSAPSVAITGVDDGAYYAGPVSPDFETDTPDAQVEATLDGAPFEPGSEVAAEGTHVFSVKLTDGADHVAVSKATFTVDTTNPEITVNGVADGDVVKSATVSVSFSDANPKSTELLLDGEAFTSGTTVSDPGTHILQAKALDKAGNESTVTLAFTVDQKAPVVVVDGLVNGHYYAAPVAPLVTTDTPDADLTIELDGQPYVPGTEVSKEGVHVLTVVAVDSAGNVAETEVTFTIDTTPPDVKITGVTNGSVVQSATPVVTLQDDHLAGTVVTLDGEAFVSGTVVDWDGVHVLVATATDEAGNETSKTVTFTVDTLSPVVTVDGVSDGGFYAEPVTPDVQTDSPNATVTATLDGEVYEPGTEIAGEGEHVLTVEVTDLAGHVSETTLTFVIDTTPPVVQVTGISDGDTVTSATPEVTVTDDHLDTTTVTLDGEAFEVGDTVDMDGDHELVVTAKDMAGNETTVTVGFVVDSLAPVVSVSGVTDGGAYDAPVTPEVQTDSPEATMTLTLDGEPYVSGTEISAEGAHELAIHVEDAAGHSADTTVSFLIDTTPPIVLVTGIEDGAVVAEATPEVVITDVNLVQSEVTLDGQPFASGTPVIEPGEHTLIAWATDVAGNETTVTVGFTVDVNAPLITVNGVEDGSFYSAPVTIEVGVISAIPATLVVTLDGLPFESGTEVAAEGEHDLVAEATSDTGVKATVSVTFVIDATAPVVTIEGVEEGGLYAPGVVATFSANDAYLAQVEATLDGAPFESGSAIDGEGPHTLHVGASDQAGNTTDQDVTFTVNGQVPSLKLVGVEDGAFVNEAVAVTAEASEGATVELTLDGEPYTGGAPIEAEGSHVVSAKATSPTGFESTAELTFTIDLTAPVVELAGVEEGAYANGPVAVTASVDEVNPDKVDITLDGSSYDGSAIDAEGPHVVEAIATDLAGNEAGATRSFVVDTTAPVVTINGVVDGGTYDKVAPVVTVQEANPDELEVMLDGQPFESGTVVTAIGQHEIHAVATDLADNVGEASVSFAIEGPTFVVHITRSGMALAGARVFLYDASGTYTGFAGVLNGGGEWTVEGLLPGEYRARVDHLWRRYITKSVSFPATTILSYDLPPVPEYLATVYVRSDATGTGDGTEKKPHRTIGAALEGAGFGTLVKVAGGIYAEGVVVPDGVAIEGGYDPASWTLDPSTQTTVLSGDGGHDIVSFDGAFHGELANVTVRGGGVRVTESSPLLRDLIVTESPTGDGSAIWQKGGDYATVVNVLAAQNGGASAIHIEDAPTHLWNLTVAHNEGDGVHLVGAEVLVERAIVAQNGGVGIRVDGAPAAHVTESDVWDNDGGAFLGDLATDGTLDKDPIFLTGALHDYYLSQVDAGDEVDSPAVDAASKTAAELELLVHTTAVSGLPDQGQADLGFHAAPVSPVAPPPVDEGPGGDDIGGGPGDDIAGSVDAGSTSSDATAEDDAAGGDTGGTSGGDPGGCGNCNETGGGVPLPPGGIALLILVALAYSRLRRRARG